MRIAEQIESEDCLGDETVPFLGGEVGATRGKCSAKMILECVNHTFGGVAAICIWGDKWHRSCNAPPKHRLLLLFILP